MKTGIVNETNKMVHDGSKGQKVTIIKSFFCNGEGHYLTKEIGEIPDMFVDVDKPQLKGIVSELLENVQELSYASDRNEDCGNVFSSLKSVAHHLNEDLKDLEGI